MDGRPELCRRSTAARRWLAGRALVYALAINAAGLQRRQLGHRSTTDVPPTDGKFFRAEAGRQESRRSHRAPLFRTTVTTVARWQVYSSASRRPRCRKVVRWDGMVRKRVDGDRTMD